MFQIRNWALADKADVWRDNVEPSREPGSALVPRCVVHECHRRRGHALCQEGRLPPAGLHGWHLCRRHGPSDVAMHWGRTFDTWACSCQVYVALMDVMRESEAAFERYHKDRSKAAVTTAWCFFAGMVVVYLTRVAKRRLSKLLRRNDGDATRPAPDANGAAATDNERDRDAGADNASQNDDRAAVRTGSPDNATAPSDSVSVPVDAAPDDAGSRTSEVDEDLEEGITLVSKQTVISTVVALLKLAVYNVPEGFVTCVVAIHEPSMGISVAVRILSPVIGYGLISPLSVVGRRTAQRDRGGLHRLADLFQDRIPVQSVHLGPRQGRCPVLWGLDRTGRPAKAHQRYVLRTRHRM